MPGTRSTIRRPRGQNKPKNNLAYPAPSDGHHTRIGWSKPSRTRAARQDLSIIVRSVRGKRAKELAEERHRNYIHQLSEVSTFMRDAIANKRRTHGLGLTVNRFMDRVKEPRRHLAMDFVIMELMTYPEDRRFVERTVHEVMIKLQSEHPQWFYRKG